MAIPFGWQELAETIAAVGGLGAAAVGLVDATKWARGGISNAGYQTVRKGLTPYAGAFKQSIGDDWEDVFRSAWLNGKPKDEQLVAARNFIRLGLTPETAPSLARACAVREDRLTTVAQKIAGGEQLDTQEFEVLGRMDASIEAKLGAAYDRADQTYRSSARLLAGVTAVGLALLGWWLVLDADADYLGISLLAGAAAVPVAPLVKDLISGLSASAHAMKALKGAP